MRVPAPHASQATDFFTYDATYKQFERIAHSADATAGSATVIPPNAVGVGFDPVARRLRKSKREAAAAAKENKGRPLIIEMYLPKDGPMKTKR